MAHNINTYIGRQAAWHSLGTVTGKYSTWTEILAHGGLDFSVFKSQLYDARGRKLEAYGMFRWDKAKDPSALDTVFLGSVGKEYTPIHHAKGFELIDSLVASKDGAHYETAGVLGNGEVVWGLADLSLSISVGDDKQNGYLLFATSHDGSMSHVYRTTFTRVVCQNTLNIALGERAKAQFRVRHTKNAQDRINDAHKTLQSIAGDAKSVEDKLNYLASRKVTRESLAAIMERLFPAKKTDDGKAVESSRHENILSAVLANYESNDGNAFPDQRGTAYNLLNAITEYADHDRSSRGGKQAESAMFGSADTLKTKAYQVIYETADGMPEMKTAVVYSSPLPKPPVSTGSHLLDSIVDAIPA